ncbi:MAG: nucleotide-binding protein [Candidatus Poribacteria bacterium]|nr:nucleotide-binding protein [Candidatus Poribacteria bacterium]
MKLFDSLVVAQEQKDFIHKKFDRDEMDYLHYEGYVENYIGYVEYKINEYRTDMTDCIKSLEGIRNRLELFEEPEPPERIFGDKVFIVHGHDEAAKHKIARFIADLDLTETILDEQPSKGQTMIDKFEEYADEAGFAIVLLTADDIGAPKDQEEKLQPRARQT